MSDPIDNGIKLLKDIVVGHTHHAATHRFALFLSISIVFALADMTIAIDFDDQHCIVAAEIDDVAANSVLPAKALTMDLRASQTTPK